MLTGNVCNFCPVSTKKIPLSEDCEGVAVKVTPLFFPFRKQDFQQEGDEMRCRHKYIDQSHVIYELFFQRSALRIRQGAEPLPQRERGIAPSGQTGTRAVPDHAYAVCLQSGGSVKEVCRKLSRLHPSADVCDVLRVIEIYFHACCLYADGCCYI